MQFRAADYSKSKVVWDTIPPKQLWEQLREFMDYTPRTVPQLSKIAQMGIAKVYSAIGWAKLNGCIEEVAVSKRWACTLHYKLIGGPEINNLDG